MERKKPSVYLDNHSTTPVDPRVVSIVSDVLLTQFGNPNNKEHSYGDMAAKLVDSAKQNVASLVAANPKNVLFTSSATEAISRAFAHFEESFILSRKISIAVPPTEHKAVLDPIKKLVSVGKAEVYWLQVDNQGRLDLDELSNRCADGIDLACIMAANNEIGTIHPLDEACKVLNNFGVTSLIDATQAAGKVPLDITSLGISYLCLSGHKLYAPKGVGALVCAGDMRNFSSDVIGTPNVPGIVGLGEACRLRESEMSEDEKRIESLRDRLEVQLKENLPTMKINGDASNRLAGNLHFSVPGVENSAVMARLFDKVAISTGSACNSGAEEPSHVLTAIGLDQLSIDGAFRIGLGKFTTPEEIEIAAASISDAIKIVQNAM